MGTANNELQCPEPLPSPGEKVSSTEELMHFSIFGESFSVKQIAANTVQPSSGVCVTE